MALTFRKAVPSERDDAQRSCGRRSRPMSATSAARSRPPLHVPAAAIERGDVYFALDGEEIVGVGRDRAARQRHLHRPAGWRRRARHARELCWSDGARRLRWRREATSASIAGMASRGPRCTAGRPTRRGCPGDGIAVEAAEAGAAAALGGAVAAPGLEACRPAGRCAIVPSMRASTAPRHICTPEPKAKWRLGSRPASKRSGSANCAGSRLAAPMPIWM